MTSIILILTALTLTAIWLDAIRAAINSLSGGYIRSLNQAKSSKAEKWLNKQREYGFILRALSFLVTAMYTTKCYYHTIVNPFYIFDDKSFQSVKETCIFALLLLLFLILKETLGTIWFSHYRYTLLRFSIPLINLLHLPLKFYELILMHSLKKAKARENITELGKEVSPEHEILSLVESNESGTLEDDEKRMIQGVFDLNDTMVLEAMTPRVKVIAICIDNTIEQARAVLVESTFSRLPVYDKNIDSIIGLLYAKDFINHEKTKDSNLETLMHSAQFTPDDKPLDELLEDFKKSQCHFAVVNDKFGGTAGIITIEDVLEEIVGDIKDEFDNDDEAPDIKKSIDGTLTINAETPLDDINKILPGNIIPDHDGYETIGGCIYSEISRIPAIGEIIELNKYTAEILDADERSIIKLKLTPKLKENFEKTKS